jgi:hypothetical protein
VAVWSDEPDPDLRVLGDLTEQALEKVRPLLGFRGKR